MKVAVVGYPNVGKSSASSTASRRAARRSSTSGPGITRDRKELSTDWNGRSFTLIDTGGVDLDDEDPLAVSIQDQARAALADAQVALFVVDARAGMRPGDAGDRRHPAPRQPADRRRREQDRLAAATCRSRTTSTASASASRSPVSAAQGLGTGDLLDALVELLPEDDEIADDEDEVVRLAVIGRPNVGKSSLVNAFLGRERVIVSDVAGTTRDAIDTPIEVDGRKLILVDTAGIRRQAKVTESVEYYTTLRSQRAAERADVALVVCDAQDGITSQDLRIAELAMKSGCATALVLNKWDMTGGDRRPARPGRRRRRGRARRRARAREPASCACARAC